jgi:hypothetical protein
MFGKIKFREYASYHIIHKLPYLNPPSSSSSSSSAPPCPLLMLLAYCFKNVSHSIFHAIYQGYNCTQGKCLSQFSQKPKR